MARDDDRGYSRSSRDDDDRGSRRSSRDDDRRSSRDDDRRGGRGDAPRFQYRSRDPDSLKRRAESGGSDNDPYFNPQVGFFKAAEGDNTLRVLPPTWNDAEHFGVEVYLHYNIGPDKAAYLCLHKMKGEECPICTARAKALDNGDEEYANELRPEKRVLTYVLDREHEKEGVMLWSVSRRMDQDVARLCRDKKTGEALEIDHPEHGYDLTFERVGQGLKTRYSGMQIARRESPLDNDKALQFAVDNPLPDQLIYYSFEHIESAFRGTSSKKSSRDDDDRRGGRDSERKPDRDDDRRSSRDDDRRSSTRRVDLPTWAQVHDMRYRDLAGLVAEHKLDIDPEASRDDEELADSICEELGITRKGGSSRDDVPANEGRSTTRARLNDDPPADESPRDRLRRMRGDN